MERKKRQRYSNEFRRQAVERMHGCDNIVRLARELGSMSESSLQLARSIGRDRPSPYTISRTDFAQTNPQTQAIVSK